MKVAVKQTFDNIDEIIFEAAIVSNAIGTQYKLKDYTT